VMMPRLDGLEVLKLIKAQSRFASLPVIIQTAAASPEQVAEGLELGANYYLTKPYEGASLRAVVRTALAAYTQSRALADNIQIASSGMPLLQEGKFRFKTIADARRLAIALARACPKSEIAAIGLTELMVNAVEHGNLGIGYQEKSALMREGTWEQEIERRLGLQENAGKSVEVEFMRVDGKLHFSIRDAGEGFDASRYLELAPERAYDLHGRGIAMARKLSFASLEYRGTGNEVVATVLDLGAAL